MKKFTVEEIRVLLFNRVMIGDISFPEMVEILNERVSEIDEPQYKDGDFVVNEAGSILIFKEKVGDFIYDHAYLASNLMLFTSPDAPTFHGINCYATEEEKQKMLDALAKKGERWNAEKKCIEDIPKRKFIKGDKVRIKHGVSSKTNRNIEPWFLDEMDGLIGTTMTVSGYTTCGRVVCNESSWKFHEDWLEPYTDELKEGDLAIFWDTNKDMAVVRFYRKMVGFHHIDITGGIWRNAVKFESKEQYERLIKREI